MTVRLKPAYVGILRAFKLTPRLPRGAAAYVDALDVSVSFRV